jgi:hypothetical protein
MVGFRVSVWSLVRSMFWISLLTRLNLLVQNFGNVKVMSRCVWYLITVLCVGTSAPVGGQLVEVLVTDCIWNESFEQRATDSTFWFVWPVLCLVSVWWILAVLCKEHKAPLYRKYKLILKVKKLCIYTSTPPYILMPQILLSCPNIGIFYSSTVLSIFMNLMPHCDQMLADTSEPFYAHWNSFCQFTCRNCRWQECSL